MLKISKAKRMFLMIAFGVLWLCGCSEVKSDSIQPEVTPAPTKEPPYDTIKYEKIDDDNVRILSITTKGNQLIIPSKVDGYHVKEIGLPEYAIDEKRKSGDLKVEGAYTPVNTQKNLVSIVIEEGVEVIAGSAFFETSIPKMILPKSLKKVESFAFLRAKKLRKLITQTSQIKIPL